MGMFDEIKYVESLWQDEVGSGYLDETNRNIALLNDQTKNFSAVLSNAMSYLSQKVEYVSKREVIETLLYKEEQ